MEKRLLLLLIRHEVDAKMLLLCSLICLWWMICLWSIPSVVSAQPSQEQLQRVKELEEQRNYQEALRLLRQMVKEQKSKLEIQKLQLRVLSVCQKAGKLDAVKALLERAMLQEQKAENYWLLGQIAWMQGDQSLAVPLLFEATVVEPYEPTYHLWLGIAYWYLGELSRAQVELDKAIRLDESLKELVKDAQQQLATITIEVKPTLAETERPTLPPPPPAKLPAPAPPTPTPPREAPAGEAAPATIQAVLSDNGVLQRVLVGRELCLVNLCFRVAPPGFTWPPIARQLDVPVGQVRKEQIAEQTVFTGTALTQDGKTIQWREAVSQSPKELTVVYELTPQEDITMESVLIEAMMPLAALVNNPYYLVQGGQVKKGVFPQEKTPTPVFEQDAQREAIGWWLRSGRAIEITTEEKQPGGWWQLQDNRHYGAAMFEFQIHSGKRGQWAKGETVILTLTIKPKE